MWGDIINLSQIRILIAKFDTHYKYPYGLKKKNFFQSTIDIFSLNNSKYSNLI